MKIIFAVTFMCLALPQPLSAGSPQSQQTAAPGMREGFDTSGVRLKSIRRVKSSAVLKGKPGVEIVLHTTKPLYIGALLWVLHVGRHQFDLGGTDSPQTMTYTLTLKQWGKLRDGDPLYLTYGVEYRREREPASGFALLNKRLLEKRQQ